MRPRSIERAGLTRIEEGPSTLHRATTHLQVWLHPCPPLPTSTVAGILNANALYSFTIGMPQLGFAFYFLLVYAQDNVVVMSTTMSLLSIILSLANICCNFPRHLRKIAEKKAEQARDHLEAMRSTKATVQRLQEEADEEKKHRFGLAQNDNGGGAVAGGYYVGPCGASSHRTRPLRRAPLTSAALAPSCGQTPSRVLDDVMKVEWNLMVNEIDVMWQQMHRTQLKNAARKDAKEGVDPFKNKNNHQNMMLKRVPFFAGSNKRCELPRTSTSPPSRAFYSLPTPSLRFSGTSSPTSSRSRRAGRCARRGRRGTRSSTRATRGSRTTTSSPCSAVLHDRVHKAVGK